MRIAVLSDIHDQVWKLDAALASIRDTDAMICCGDLCSPFVVHQIGRGYAKPVHIVFGNNDGDLYRITAVAARYEQVRVHGELFVGELGGRRVAVNHFDNIARPLAASGQFELVCFGHNHRYETGRAGKTVILNPGTILGAAFTAGGMREDVASTFAIYDSESESVSAFEVPASGDVRSWQPPPIRT